MEFKIDYREYPEYMFGIIAAYLPEREGHDLRRAAGSVVFKHTDRYGYTYKNGLRHSYNDLPAIRQVWDEKGHFHTEEDLPAIIDKETNVWYKDGKCHRDGDKPAVISGDIQEWWINGKRHREGDLPAFIDGDDYKLWYKNGERHRDGDRPAVIDNEYVEWWKNGKIHRDHDLPALIDNEYLEWWIQGERTKIVVNKYSQSYINLVVESRN